MTRPLPPKNAAASPARAHPTAHAASLPAPKIPQAGMGGGVKASGRVIGLLQQGAIPGWDEAAPWQSQRPPPVLGEGIIK